MIDDTRRFVYTDFGSWASPTLTVECEDGEVVTLLNARYTVEQLREHMPHEDTHIKNNHFQDDRPIQELEAEADAEPSVSAKIEEYAKKGIHFDISEDATAEDLEEAVRVIRIVRAQGG